MAYITRVSEENKRELEKLREAILLQLQECEYLRRIAEEVIAKAKKRLVFVVGEAGIGKSKLLYLIWKKLKERREKVGYS